MKLYTFQPLFVWQYLEETGYFHPHRLYEVDDFLMDEYPWSFRQAYDWLKGRMDNKGVKFLANNQHMIWAWYQWDGTKRPKPDKRFESVFNYMDEPFVIMELDICDDRVCLTDYETWHGVLNYWHMGSEEQKEDFWNKFDRKVVPLVGDPHDEISRTWDLVFDMQKSQDWLETTEKDQQIQATFFELFYTDVKKVHFFENKKCIRIQTITHKQE